MASLGVVRVDRLEAGDPSHIGPFQLLGRLGEGGMGRVFLGASPGGRKVAIKVVHPRHAHDPEFRRRFAREVAAARQVGGFHAALVVDANPDADPPWMATAYIPGPSLADAVDRHGPLAEAAVRELGAALAEGLGAIHACGIIHRDLKPGNIIMADDGPRIIDFGIAKSADASSLTGSNVVMGTLRYMSPEQLNGEQVTQQSDIFALGAILTYAATGHNPFDGPNIPATIAQILNDPPNLEPLAGELRDVIAACMAREPGARPSPAGLLTRFNALKPAGGATAAAPAVQAPTQLMTAVTAQVPASGPARATAQASWPAGAMMAPQAKPAAAPAPSPVSAPAPALAPGPRPFVRTVPQRRYRRPVILAVAGAVVVAGLAAGLIALIDKHPATVRSATGTLLATLSDSTSQVAWSVAFGPDHILATGDRSGRTYLWNTTTRQTAGTLSDVASKAGVFSAAFGPAGLLATGENDGRTDLWNTTTRQTAGTLSDPSNQVVPSVAFAPDGTLATDQVHSVDVWNTATGSRTATITDPGTGGIFSVAFSEAGILAAGDDNGHAYLWNTATRTIVATLADPSSKGVDSVAFAPGGTLATGDSNGHTYLWNTTTGKLVGTLTDPGSTGVNSVAFAPGGTLATGDHNGRTYLWTVTYHQS